MNYGKTKTQIHLIQNKVKQINSKISDYLDCVFSEWDRMQYADLSEANLYKINEK